jgi:hypothetical protein
MGKITDYELNSCIEGHKAKNNLSRKYSTVYIKQPDKGTNSSIPLCGRDAGFHINIASDCTVQEWAAT